MQVTVTGKQMDVGESLRGHAETATAAIADKYLGKAIEAHVVFCHERHLFLSDISLHAWRGLTVQCHGEAADAYAAFDDAALRLEKQLRRYKRRLRARHKGGKAGEETAQPEAEPATDYVLAAEPAADAEAGEGGHDPVIVAEMRTSIPYLSVSEAVMRLDLADLPALLFRNSAHGNLNLVYRRRDGNIGWVDPGLAAGDQAERGRTS
jgi:ribosome hibernation promoting factor